MDKKNKLGSEFDLNLEDAPQFVSESPKMSFKEYIEWCEQFLPESNKTRFSQPDNRKYEPFVFNDEAIRLLESLETC